MKVIVAVILAIGSASALGSGPYLPSGWRPQGPAFYLPSESQKPADNPLKETILFETEASGSEGLREYGLPKVQETLNIVQTLPDVVTDQAFYVINVSEEQAGENVEQKAEIVQEVTTDTQVTEAVESRAQDFELETEVSTASYKAVTDKAELVTDKVEIVTDNAEVVTGNVEVVTDNAEVVTDKAEIIQAITAIQEVEATFTAVEEKLENIIVQEEKQEKIVVEEENLEKVVVETVEGVNNIAEALANLENEIRAQQVQENIEAVGELKITQEGSGSAQVPEGFLEYGPPGFKEYGPPKGDELLRATSFENNETRRRRFSPKFRSSKNKRH